MTSPQRRARRLYKDPTDKTIAGVASGVAKYFDVDTTLVRAIWFVLAFSGFGILLYVILWLVLEDEPQEPATPLAEEMPPVTDETAYGSTDGPAPAGPGENGSPEPQEGEPGEA